ncbi:hypothetical protein [Bdellovibrio sp. HCB337]|uniref:hypothetical protein n=1 Tax=Bdellovibrio sp. HCB337 TaxID=3394358 RepID=UPI0039A5A1CF
MKSRLAKFSIASAVAAMVVGCSKGADSFSLLSDGSSYKQSAQYIPRKVDILWVVDNSGSMATSQKNLADNFPSFIQKFLEKESDFRMAVVTSDAFLAPYHAKDKPTVFDYKDLSLIRGGVMDKNTPNLESVFLTNIQQGTSGSGDERVFSSFETALMDPRNSAFRRPDAFLAVIIVSDEEDFSHNDNTNGMNTYKFMENYADPTMYSVQHYVDFLTTFTANAGSGKNFSVNTISILDQACLTKLQNSAQKIGQRYIDLANATGGKKASLCEDFSDSLKVLADAIVNLSSEFSLSREPIPESIVVTVNGVVVPNDPVNGWVYNPATITLTFNGSSLPKNGDDVRINFDPANVKQ